MDSVPPRIRFDRISKSYAGVRALDAVSFDVRPGCIHALVGENGAGKSTLMKILAGAVRADAGAIELDGAPAMMTDARTAQRLGIAIVYQEFNLIAHLSVSENVYLGRWPRAKMGIIRNGEMNRQAQRLFDELGLPVPVRAPVADLSVAQQQMVEIAKALSLDARVLILDEPSAVLTPHELAALFRVIRELAARGVTILYISHRFDEIFELADDVTVLRDGQHISTRPIRQVDRRQLIAECVGRPLEEEFPPRLVEQGAVALQVERLSCTGIFSDVSFDVREGEVLALTGLVGSGRSSVALSIYGALPATKGRIVVGDAVGPFRSPIEAQHAGIAYVPEDRRHQGLLMARSLRENLTLARREDAAVWGLLSVSRERVIARRRISQCAIKAAGTEIAAATLSGGNQQKLLLARWLDRPFRVMILDEPTRGVDVGAKSEIYAMINAIAAQGTAILMVSSDLPEALGMADRIAVMSRGRLTGILANRDRQVTQEQVLRLALGESAS
ncbi:MAG TPA: sugar ABC transporter ATP-binding protein [Phycisphaerae bacterium]|nr:sugar ABC transporter ATP-binding protein [Phycisphaerae bacterium]